MRIHLEELESISSSYHFAANRGQVISCNSWTETYTETRGPGHSRVDTSVHHYIEFWLKLQDGSEVSYTVDANKVSIRPSQHVIVVGHYKSKGWGKNRGDVAFIWNLSTDRVYTITGNHDLATKRFRLFHYAAIFYSVFGIVSYWLPHPAGLIHFAFTACYLFYSLAITKRYAKHIKKIKAFLADYAEIPQTTQVFTISDGDAAVAL